MGVASVQVLAPSGEGSHKAGAVVRVCLRPA